MALLLASGVVGLATAGCDRDEPRPPAQPAPMSAASLAKALGKDAADLVETVDPAPAAGDLKSEVERFTTLDACVAQHNALDPLVGDGLLAIGYDNFLRDTCRLLDATQAHDAKRCVAIEASALRARCEAYVAMASSNAEACPLDIPGDSTRGREPTCVAMATRDVRLCAGEISNRRVGCEALVSRDEKHCAALANKAERRLCERESSRWKTMLDQPTTGLPPLPAPHLHVEVHAVEGSIEPPQPKSDDASDAERGVVIVKELATVRLRIGSLIELGAVPHSAGASVRMGLLLAVVKDAPTEAKVERFELEVPGALTLTSPGNQADLHATVTKLDRVRGGEVQIVVKGTMGTAPHAYRVEATITTFVRDLAKHR
ncbi:MAG: hypothetical protein ABIP39_01740 [Polyangiaceae bacterium]